MGLSTSDAAGSFEGGGIKITDGVFANLQKIKKVKDLSGKKLEFTDKVFDLAIEVEYEDERFPITYLGNLKTDASGEVTGWGGAFVVAKLFEAVGETAELDINNRFKPTDLKRLIGKELYTVSYTSGTYQKDDGTKGNAYKNWNIVFDAREEEDELKGIILEEWQRSRAKGYPSNYTLPINADPSNGNSLSTGSTASKSSVTSDIDDLEDDDLPF